MRHQVPLTAAHIRPGMPVNYYVRIDEQKVWTGGIVTHAVKTGEKEITIRLVHRKTGTAFVNTLRAGKAVWLHRPTLARIKPHLFASTAQAERTLEAIRGFQEEFWGAPVGAVLVRELVRLPDAGAQRLAA